MSRQKPITRQILIWYKKNKRDLPWRRTSDPYKIWISEIMLQQTTVSAVIPYYKRWIKIFPTVYDVARAPLSKVLKQWQGLGYYSRARNIHKAVRIIIRKHNGKIPDNREELMELPGFGPYTVGAVLSIAFDKPEAIIDANVRRVFMRILAKRGQADPRHDQDIKKYLHELLPVTDAGAFNQGLMELGALVCRNKEPVCSMCPVKKTCKAYAKGIQEIIPQPKTRILRDINVAIGIIEKDGKYFIQKRASSGLLADLWEFPGGKIEAGEDAAEALKREIKEELDVDVYASKHLFNLTHFYTQFRVNLNVSACRVTHLPRTDKAHKWTSLKHLQRFPMPSGSAKIVDRLLSISFG